MTSRRLQFAFAESDVVELVVDRRKRRRLRVGTIYRMPYPHQLDLACFPVRVANAVLQRTSSGSPDVDASSPSTLLLLLTPALQDGECTVVEKLPHYAAVYCGLAVCRWEEASTGEKRRIVMSRVIAASSLVADWLPIPAASLVQAAKQVEADDVSLPARAAPVGEDLYRALCADSPVAVHAHELRNRLQALGHDHTVSLTNDDVSFVDDRSGVRFLLSPGGPFRGGFSDEQLSALGRVWGQPVSPTLTPFGADAPCDLTQRPEAHLDPVLIAERPLADGAVYTLEEARVVLDDHDWSVPRSSELECAVTARRPVLFPWGDDVGPIRRLLDVGAAQLMQEYGLAAGAETPSSVPGRNPIREFEGSVGIGLRSALSRRTWCLPSSSEDPTPLIFRGGALDFAPWQSGEEALLFLVAAESRCGVDGRYGPTRAALRPIIRLMP